MNRRTCKPRIFVYDEWRTGSGTTVTPWRELIDDPKHGIHDLSDWIKKYGSGRPVRREKRKGTHWSEYAPATGKATESDGNRQHPILYPTKFPELTEEQKRTLESVNANKSLKRYFNRLAENLIASDRIELNEKEAFIEFMKDQCIRKVALYDPNHPPKYKTEDGGPARPASVETFICHTAGNSIKDFLRHRSKATMGTDVCKVPISSLPAEEAEKIGEISVEALVDEHRTIRQFEFAIDFGVLRAMLPSDKHRMVLDRLILENTDTEIRSELGISEYSYKYKVLAVIQNLAADLGFEPSDENSFVDKMYVFRRKIRRSIRENGDDSRR